MVINYYQNINKFSENFKSNEMFLVENCLKDISAEHLC